MNRIEKVIKYIDKKMKGIEIAPWHTPLAPKRDGWNCLSLDLFSLDELRQKNQNDENLSNDLIENIEEVDVVGSASDIEELIAARDGLGTFDYIISSHNFEHLPNPIKFLQGAAKVLKENGILSMAIPDKRGCFDYFRPHSITADFLAAYAEDRVMPTVTQIFAHGSLNARYGSNLAFLQTGNPRGVQVDKNLMLHYKNWVERSKNKPTECADTHCHVFTPSSFYLIMIELQFLGLMPFHVIEIEQTGGVEFYVHMRKMPQSFKPPEDQFYLFRQQLLHQI
ncbi:MAG: class I SAM-dependent methyltransferase, partial [Porticoccaceae bacterium]